MGSAKALATTHKSVTSRYFRIFKHYSRDTYTCSSPCSLLCFCYVVTLLWLCRHVQVAWGGCMIAANVNNVHCGDCGKETVTTSLIYTNTRKQQQKKLDIWRLVMDYYYYYYFTRVVTWKYFQKLKWFSWIVLNALFFGTEKKNLEPEIWKQSEEYNNYGELLIIQCPLD